MKNKLFNVIVYGLLVYSILTGVHTALPPEYQISGFSNLTALISGASTALVGSAGLAIKSWLSSAKKTAETKQIEVYKEFIKIVEKYEKLEAKLTATEKTAEERYQVEAGERARIIALLETDLKAKLSNKLIDEETRALINGVLNEKEVV